MSMRNWFKEPDPKRRKDEAAFRVKLKDKPELSALSIRPRQLAAGAMSVAVAAALVVFGLTPAQTADDAVPPTAQADTASDITLARDCVLLQHMVFTPCGHELTRREALPADLIGKTRADLETAFDLWRVTSFDTHEVTMEQQLAMYCPEHVILMPDDSGYLCVWHNLYGDALSLVRELHIPLSDFSDPIQSQLRPGLGFDTETALIQWLESAES